MKPARPSKSPSLIAERGEAGESQTKKAMATL